MNISKLFASFKELLTLKRKRFEDVCRRNQLQLDYARNKNNLALLQSIFDEREYADYFPFQQKATVVDIGAHHGYFSLYAQQSLVAGSIIYAIEPDTTNFNNLVYNSKGESPTLIIPMHNAVGGTCMKTILYKSNSTNHTIIRTNELPQNNNLQEEVDVITIEELMRIKQIDSIDFLKMDCEGAEYEILFNCNKNTLDRIKTISMEFHDLKSSQLNALNLIEYLKKQNFNIAKFTYSPTRKNLNYGKIVATRL